MYGEVGKVVRGSLNGEERRTETSLEAKDRMRQREERLRTSALQDVLFNESPLMISTRLFAQIKKIKMRLIFSNAHQL